MLRLYGGLLLVLLARWGAASTNDGPSAHPFEPVRNFTRPLLREEDIAALAVSSCPGSPATLGAGSTSTDLNDLLLVWATAGAVAGCSGVLTFTAPTASAYSLNQAYGVESGEPLGPRRLGRGGRDAHGRDQRPPLQSE